MAAEQLWDTTRSYLIEELEDKLQQLFYTLETFSEVYVLEWLWGLLTIDWIKKSLYFDTIQYQSVLNTVLFVKMAFSSCDKTVLVKWITWYSVNFIQQLLMMFVYDSISQEFKLELKTKRFTVSCLSQSIEIIISTAMCQHLSLPVLVLISLCHLLLISAEFKSWLSTAWNQRLIHSCWICYITISNIRQPYICVCVMWHKGTSIYISYCQLNQATQPNCNMLHSYQLNTAAKYRVFYDFRA